MSATIDERIVEMRFDNRQFEANVQTSLSTLDKLKQGLNLDGAAKGLEGIGDAAKKCDMSKLSSSVETVQAKFSALEVMAMTALSNITNSALNAGKRLISAFTIDPIKTGFDEYELKMGSIQTIMASTGESLDRVNQKLDELNTYSDRTVYSFSDMTSNIGKFTNAGVKLDDAVAAIQGVSNVAAVSGANANEASRAMYNFAQALSAGYVKLIDWKSIENANMATVEFKTQLLESAVAAGTLTKTTDGMYKTLKGNVLNATQNFNDTLQDQWMTTDALIGTLKDYADETTNIGKKAFAAAQDVKTFTQLMDTLKESAQSGWAETWQLIVGDYEEAKGTLREFSAFFSTIIDKSSDARNSMLRGALMSGWGQLKDQVSGAGFAVDDFEKALRETATESVNGFDQMVEKAGSFTATLSEGWLTTDILAKTLDKLANEATGTTGGIAALTDEQLKNIGYTDEQIQSLRELGKQASSISGPIADLVQNMTKKSGRELLFDSILNVCKGLQKVFGTLKGAWNDIFPPATSQQLYGIITAINEFSKKLILSDETADKIGRTFKGLFAVLDIVKQAFSAVFNALAPLTGGLGSFADGVLNVTATIGDWLVGLDQAIEKNDIFNKAVQKVTGFIQGAITAVKAFGETIQEKFNLPSLDEAKESVKGFLETIREKIGAPGLELIHTLLDKIKERLGQVKEAITEFKNGITTAFDEMDRGIAGSKFLHVLQTIWNGVKSIAGGVADGLGGLISTLINAVGNADFSGIIDFVNALSFGGIALAMKKFTEPLEAIGGIKDSIIGILDGVRGCFEAYQTQLKAGTLLKIAAAIAILTASIIALSIIDSEKLNSALGAITLLFVELMGSMAVFDKISGASGVGMAKTSAAMVLMSVSILILANAMRTLGDLEWEDIAKGLIGVAGLAAIVVASSKVLSSGSGGVIKGATGLVIFAAAIKVLTSACKDLSSLSWEELAIGLTGVGILLAEVAGFLKVAKFDGKAVSTAVGIVILSAAIKVLASACKDFGGMDTGNLVQGLVAVGALLAELSIFTKIAGGSKNMVSIGTGMVILAASMKIFASAVGDFGGMDISVLVKGLAAMGVALAEVAIAMNFMPKNMIGIGTGLVIVGAALEIVANVMGRLGAMSLEEIGKGLVTMGVALAELAIALNFMKGTLAGSAAMLVASTALLALIPTLKILGGMSWEAIVKGLVAVGGAFVIIGAAGAVLTPLVPAILGLGAALALIGVGVVAAAAGITLMAAGITALSLALVGGATSIVAGLTVIITGVAALIPAIVAKIGEAIIEFCKVIAQGAPAIAEAVKAVVLSLVDMLVECVPAIADGALALITGVLEALVTYTPRIVDALFQFLIGVLEGIARNIPALIQSGVDIFMAFFSGLTDALSSIDPDVLLKGIIGVGLLAGVMAALSAMAGLIPGAMVGVLGMGVIIAELALVLAAIGALAQIPGLSWLINEGGKLLEGIGTAIGSFVGGIVGGFMSGISGQFPQIGADLAAFMTNVQPFIDGASKITPDMLSGVKALTEVILLLTAADILQGLTSWLTGGSSLADFATQLVPFGEAMMGFSQAIAGMDGNLVANAALAGRTLAEMAATLPNSGGVLGFFAGENDMESFGEQLTGFGNAMVGFADTVKGLDADVVLNAATAGKAMAEMAATLPNSGGVAGFFAGENDMDAFGEQLVPFGRAIKNFSDEVRGLDVDAVTNSGIAGQAMVELAKTIPNSGGAVAFFTGENNLDDFGAKLISFGASIKAYSNSVKGLDVDAVTNSANAGQALVALANTVPNCGGLVSFFTGDNSIADFGSDLVLFGSDLAAYSNAISAVQPDAVTASANAAGALSTLAAGLPDSSLFDKWFGGDQTLADFGADISAFGGHMGNYYAQISGADPAKLSSVIDQVWRLVELAEGVQAIDTSGLTSFSNALNTMALSGISGFTSAFDNCNEQIDGAVTGMLNLVSDSISSNMPSTAASMRVLVTGLVGAIQEKTPDMTQATMAMMLSVNTTIQSTGETVKVTISTLLIQSIAMINASRGQFVSAGQNVSQGFIDGIRANIQAAANAAAELASATLNAAKQRLDINSPSGVFKTLGMYVDTGLANGISENASIATNAATSIGSAIVRAFKERLEINSPSRVTKDEVGRYVVQGIAEGITEDTSAEEAATKKAQNIVNAFKTELDKFDLDASTADLEYDLWEKLNGGATSSEKEAKQTELLSNKLGLQSDKVSLAQAEYLATVDTFGEHSEEAQEAYNKLLNSQITLADLVNQINEIQSASAERNRQAFIAYADYLRDNQDTLLECGFSLEEIQRAARAHAGYDPNALTQSVGLDVDEIIASAMSDVQVAYAKTAGSTLGALVKNSNEIGTGMATAIGTGLQNGAPAAVQTGATAMVTSCSDTIKSQSQSWTDAGGVLVGAFSDGIRANTETAAAAAAEMAGKVYNSALTGIMTTSNANAGVMITTYSEALRSQSTSWAEVGSALVDGFVIGIQANQGKVTNSAYSIVTAGATGITGQKQLWVDAASALVDGFIEGIRSNVERAAQEAAAMAAAAYQAAMSAIGGGGISITGGASVGVSAYADRGNGSGGSTSRVLDLDTAVSAVKNGLNLAGTVLGFTPGGTIAKVAAAAASAASKAAQSSGAKASGPSESTSYSFTQINQSPKALDRTTIYRNTNNLFSQLKGR